MADIAVIAAGGGRAGWRSREAMSGVIVMNDNDVAIAIVAADVAPLERAAADDSYEQRGDAAAKKTITNDAEAHPFGL